MPRAQDVARWLREAIHDGALATGQPIRQEAIARELGVSRIPVRQALHELEAEGLVVLRPHSGARVTRLDYEECVEIYKMRERLEPLALSESIGRLTEAQLREAQRLALELEGLRGDPKAWIEGDRRLHLACYAGVSTPRLLGMIERFWNTTQQYRRVLLTTFSDADYAVQHREHRMVLEALATGNRRTGEEAMRIHIERSRLRLADHRDLFDA